MTKRKLYRFQPISVPDNDRLNQLRKGEVWFSDPAKFNDPFDLRPAVKNLVPDRWCPEPAFEGSMRMALASLLENAPMYQGAHLIDQALFSEFQAWAGDHAEDELDWDTRLLRAVESRIAQFGVVCLTPEWDNRLMWAHYANEGKGFCIEYEVDWLQQTQDVRYVPVHYMSETPELCVSEAMFAPHQFLQRVMASKHVDWAYEHEIRLVSLSSKGRSVALDENYVRMTGLVAGYAMPEPLRAHLKRVAEQLGIDAMEMKTGQRGNLRKEPLT